MCERNCVASYRVSYLSLQAKYELMLEYSWIRGGMLGNSVENEHVCLAMQECGILITADVKVAIPLQYANIAPLFQLFRLIEK